MRDPVSVQPLLETHYGASRLNILSVGGRPAWIAREVGAAIGYDHGGKRLVNRIRREWADEFILDHDYAFVTGDDLAQIKGLVDPDVIDPRTPSLLVLFRPGVHLVLTKTTRKVGKDLRRFLVDRVFPQLDRTGRYSPDADEAPDRVLVRLPVRRAPVPARVPLHVRREARMSLQARTRAAWVDLCDRRLKVATLHRLADEFVDEPDQRLALELLAAQIATRLPLVAPASPEPPPAAEAQPVAEAA